ncbi:hypothetical protein [Streptococcus pyogenes]|uniref:hypothetical protein n=1 Tax=Streptococcus pyogenes TaxID=1314 RepID=UPI0035A684B4
MPDMKSFLNLVKQKFFKPGLKKLVKLHNSQNVNICLYINDWNYFMVRTMVFVEGSKVVLKISLNRV